LSESFRPHESARIDEGLRIRLEGAIELLEDALPLLDSLTRVLTRAESSRDDLATLHECALQLPRIEEAIDRAHRHEQAIALTQLIGTRKQSTLVTANERLVLLGQPAAPSLRGAVTQLMDLIKAQGIAPQPGERVLAESTSPPWLTGLVLGGVLALVISNWLGAALGAVFGAVVCIAMLFGRAPSPWVLLANRIYFPPRWPRLARQLSPSAIEGLAVERIGVIARVGNEVVKLQATEPEALVATLHLLRSPWLAGLESPARASVAVDAMDDASKGAGRALIAVEGVLFVPHERRALVVKALTEKKLPVEPAIDEVLGLVAHLPEGKWAAVGAHLQKSADAIWISRDDLELEDNVVCDGERRVRLMLSRDPRRVEAEALLERLR
jgi:hypothetical protein